MESIQVCCHCRRRLGFSLQLLRDEIALCAETTTLLYFVFEFSLNLLPMARPLAFEMQREVTGTFASPSKYCWFSLDGEKYPMTH